MIKTLFIDLDDTLWDTKNNNKESVEELYIAHDGDRVYSSFSLFFSEYWEHNEELWDQYRRGLIDKKVLMKERFRRFVAPLGIKSDKELDEFNDRYIEISRRKTGVVPGAIELLKQLRSLYKIVILSNGFEEVQYDKMEAAGLLPFIDYIVLSETAKANKPSIEIFKYAVNIAQTRREECLMIGDSFPADIVGAVNFGIPSIWFNPDSLPFPDDFEYNAKSTPIYEVKQLDQIPQLLTSLRPI